MKKYFILSLVIFPFFSAHAQKTFVITPSDLDIDAQLMQVQPGDTLMIVPGTRDALYIRNLAGTVNQPIIIINDAGKVLISTKKDYGIYFDHSHHFKLTGSGQFKDSTGIEIVSSGNHGVVIAGFSSDAEVDHLHIHDVGYAAIVAKTDPACERRNVNDFIMRNLSFHDNIIHDTKAEGFYVGYSWFPYRTFQCGTDTVQLYSHEIHGIRIYNNRIYNSGQEGIQVGCGTRDVKIYNNTVFNYGTNNLYWHNHGVQIGQGTTGEFFNNTIDTGPGEAISLFGSGNNFIYNNTIKNSGVSAIYQNDRGAGKNTHYEIRNNTFINTGASGVVLVSDKTKGNLLINNTFLMLDTSQSIVDNGKRKWKKKNNTFKTFKPSL